MRSVLLVVGWNKAQHIFVFSVPKFQSFVAWIRQDSPKNKNIYIFIKTDYIYI